MSSLSQKISASQIPAMLTVCERANLTPMFVGAPGTAKTAMVRIAADQLAQHYGEPVYVRELHLASMSEVDVRGYLIPDGNQAKFTKPEFWQSVEEHKRGILFLDEFAQATHEVQKAVAPLIHEGRVGEYHLPEGWMVVLAGNRTEDNSGANTILAHVLNRITYIEVGPPDIDEWVIWATKEKLPPELIAFAKLRPQVVFKGEIPDAEDTPYCTPRSLHAAGRLANGYPGGITAMITEPVGMSLLNGAIGEGASAELLGVVRTAALLPPFERMMSEPQTCPVPTELDQQYAAVMLVAVRAEKGTHRNAAIEYLTRFPDNIALVGIVALVNRETDFLDSSALMGWVGANKHLLGKFNQFIKLR